MSLDFTVAIPAYNAATRLPQLLDRLLVQTGIDSLSWEILVVDNNSTDATATVVEDYQTRWPTSVPLRYCFEPEQGAAFARLCAVRESRGALIGFLDDDNLPAPDWIAAAVAFSQAYPQAGAFGGAIHGEFEVEPPPNFKKIQPFLAIRHHGPKPHRFEPEKLRLPPGAALVVRRQAWCDHVPPRPGLPGKRPGQFIQGDDYEPLLYLHRAGWEVWYNPAMQTYHQIPRQRLERDYLLILAKGCGLATCHLRMITTPSWQKPLLILRVFLGNLRRAVSYFLRHRQQLETDLVAAVELSFLIGCLISPLIYLRSQFQSPAPASPSRSTAKS